MTAMSDTKASVNIGRDANGNVIVVGNNNTIIFKIDKPDLPLDLLVETFPYLKEFIESFLWKEEWQKAQAGKSMDRSPDPVERPFPLASAYLWNISAPGEKELNATLQAIVASGGGVILKDLDIKLRIAQAEVAAQRESSANTITNSQSGAELMERLSKLAKEDQSERSVSKLALNLAVPDIAAKRIIQLAVDYQKAYRLKVEIRTLLGESIKAPAFITLFQKEAPWREVCQYAVPHGASVQIPEIEPGRYLLQVTSKDNPQCLWKMDLELSSALDNWAQRDS